MGKNQTLILLLLLALPIAAQESGDYRAYAQLGTKAYEYLGPDRETAESPTPDEIRIGLFVPTMGERGAAGSSMRRGAELAIAEANEAGGIDGKPLSLITRPDDFVWGSAREVVKLAYEDRVWAVAGAIGGQSTHIAEQIITKARLPLLGIATTDPSLTQINIPWMFRLMPDDDRIARTLVAHMVDDVQIRRVAMLTSTAYDHRLGGAAFERWSRRSGIDITLSLSFEQGGGFSDQLNRIARSMPDAIVLWAGAEDGVRVLHALQKLTLDTLVFAGPGFASRRVLEVEQAEGLTVVAGCNIWRKDPVMMAFGQRFQRHHHGEPDIIAAYAYDGMNLLIDAIRRGGFNRARIRDELAHSGGTIAVTGAITFDGTGSNTTAPVVLRVQDRRFHENPARR